MTKAEEKRLLAKAAVSEADIKFVRPGTKSEEVVKALRSVLMRSKPPRIGLQRISLGELVYVAELDSETNVDEVLYMDVIAPVAGVVYNVHINQLGGLRIVKLPDVPKLAEVEDTASLNRSGLIQYLKNYVQVTEDAELWDMKFKCVGLVPVTNYDAPSDAKELWQRVYHSNVCYKGLEAYNETVKLIPTPTEDTRAQVSKQWEAAKHELRKSGLKDSVKDLTTAIMVPVFVVI